MPSLKDLKNRIKSVKSTQKITKAMKMVAAAKLRRAKEAAEAARPYAEAMERMMANLAAAVPEGIEQAFPLLFGTGRQDTQLIVVATSDRGLCGGFNSTIVRSARRKIRELLAQGVQIKIMCVGRKGFEQLQGEYGKFIIARPDIKGKKIGYGDAEAVGQIIVERFLAGEFDAVHIVYNKFKSAISQIVTWQQLIPLAPSQKTDAAAAIPYECEPDEIDVLRELLPKNLSVQMYRALLENAASEQGARMTAMDNATRNAGDMIKKLNLKYNRTRQAAITKELIEIISGAEAV